jgi:hypothetical protein
MNTKQLNSLARIGALLACLAPGLSAQAVDWSEDFDSYALGISLPDPVNGTGWEEWGNSFPISQTEVQDVAAGAAVRSAPHSIWVRGTSDTVHQFNGSGPGGEGPYTSGQWTFSAWTYMPTTTTGHTMTRPSWLTLLNTYSHAGPWSWSVQISWYPLSGTWIADLADNTYTGTALFDQWVEVRAEIDLDADSVELFYDGVSMGPPYQWNGGVSGYGGGAAAIGALDLWANGGFAPASRVYWDDFSLLSATCASAPAGYCTAGTTAAGCQAQISAVGTASATASSGFTLQATGAEGNKSGIFFFSTNGRQANSWGNGTSYQCVVTPVTRAGLITGTGTAGLCDGTFSQDLNALWCASCPSPPKNPGSGALVQAQLWFRDPMNTSNQTTSLSNAVEFSVCP